MKNTIPDWICKKGKILQEIFQDISWQGKKTKKKIKESRFVTELVEKYQHETPEHVTEITPAADVPDPMEEERKLRERLDWAIRAAYCKEGGYCFYGSNLVRYVKVTMPTQDDPEIVWFAGYNSCIRPMLRQLEKLEAEIEELLSSADETHPEPDNEALLEAMRSFRQLAYDQKLHSQTDLESEAYRQTLCSYAEKLETELLIPFRYLTEQ